MGHKRREGQMVLTKCLQLQIGLKEKTEIFFLNFNAFVGLNKVSTFD
jgi:hypothetical protein